MRVFAISNLLPVWRLFLLHIPFWSKQHSHKFEANPYGGCGARREVVSLWVAQVDESLSVRTAHRWLWRSSHPKVRRSTQWKYVHTNTFLSALTLGHLATLAVSLSRSLCATSLRNLVVHSITTVQVATKLTHNAKTLGPATTRTTTTTPRDYLLKYRLPPTSSGSSSGTARKSR